MSTPPADRADRPTAEIGRLLARADETGLARTLGRTELVAIGVGAMVGGGIFVLTGIVAARFAGPGVILAYLLAGGASALTAACYAELAGLLPVAGGAYSFGRAAFGELAGWMVGWTLVLEYALGTALIAVGWAEYALRFCAGLGLSFSPGAPRILAPVAVLLVGALLAFGVRPSAYAAAVLVLVKVAAAMLFVAFGAAFIDPAHWRPFVPPNAGRFGEFGASGVVRSAGLLFFAYAGFDAIPTAAQEARSPARDVPRAILLSLGITLTLYVAVAAVLTGVVPYAHLGSVGLSQALAATGLGWLRVLVDVGIMAGLASVLLVMLLAQTRVAFAMARDGLLPKWAAGVHSRLRTPLATTGATAVAIAAATLLPLQSLGELVNAAVLLMYAGVCIAVLVLRRTAAAATRTFRVPAHPAIPVAGALACAALLAVLPPSTWWQLGLWLAAGMALYLPRRRTARVTERK